MKIEHIWPLAGIQDLPTDWQQLELASMRDVQARWRERAAQIQDSNALREFTEQLHREWAIETGRIENLYDIEQGVTISLIEHGFEAALLPPGSVNRDPDYVIRLLKDQAAALEGLFAFVKQDRPLSISYILELHQVMTASQTSVTVFDQAGNRFETELLKGRWKLHPNYPQREGKEFRYCPPEHVASEMDRLIEMHLRHAQVPAEVEAAWLHHRFTQIHPFQDGNGRIARALASLVLIRAGLFPMVVSVDEKASYLEALETADRGDLSPLVYFVARGQQQRARAAMKLALKSRPDSSSVREAVTRYAEALGLRDEAEQSRLESALRNAADQIHARCNELLEGAGATLMSQDPSVSLRLTTSSPNQTSSALRDLVRPDLPDLGALVITNTIDIRSRGHSLTIEVHNCYVEGSLGLEVLSIFVIRVGDERLGLLQSVRRWTRDELSGAGSAAELDQWLESNLAVGFDLGWRSA